MTEASLKPGWRKWRFDQIATSINDRIDNPSESDFEYYVGLEHIDPDSLKLRRWGSPSDVEATKLIFRKGDIIFGRRRVYQRKVAVAEFDGICSAHALVLKAKPEVALPEFLPFFMQTDLFMERAKQISVGSLSPTINWKTLAKEEFFLPSLDKQQKISKLLGSHFRLNEFHISALGKALDLRVAVRKKVFSEGLRGKAQQNTKIGKVPKNWDVKPLKNIFDFFDSKRIPLKEGDRQKRPGPYPYYGASGPIDSIDDYIFDEPTLLLAEDGMNLVFRNSPVVYKATGKYWVNNHAHVLKPKKDTNIDFYLEYLEHISYLPYITGTYQKKITQSDCVAIPVVFPPPDEQKEIVDIFQGMDREENYIRKRILEASDLGKRLSAEVMS